MVPAEPEAGKSHDPHLCVAHTGDWSRVQVAGMYGETMRVETPFSADPALASVAGYRGPNEED